MARFYFTFILLLLLPFSASASKGLTGVFDAGWSTWYFGADSIESMHSRLHQMGITEVILQYAIVEGNHRYYPSTLSFTQDEPNRDVFIPQSITAAEKAGNGLWLGLYYNDDNWWVPPSASQLDTLLNRNILVLKELVALYGTREVIKGFYLPQEIARYYWQTPALAERLTSHFLQPLTDSIHEMGFKVISAPFFNAELESPSQLQSFFEGLFVTWKPDIIAIQDGIGVDHVTLAKLGTYLRAVQQACVKNQIEFWVDVELFEDDKLAASTRIRAQVDSAWQAFATGVVGYDLSALGGKGLDSLFVLQASTVSTKPPLGLLNSVSTPFKNHKTYQIDGKRLQKTIDLESQNQRLIRVPIKNH